MKRHRIWIILIVALLLAAGGGYLVYTRYFALAEEAPAPTLETATVTQGDIVITAGGSGELVPAAELALTFRTSGELDEVLVEVGDRVQEGAVLARLETDELERAVAEANVDLEIAQLELADVRAGPSEAELEDARAAVRDAQVSLVLAQAAYEKTLDSNLDAAVDTRKAEYDWWVGYYQRQKSKYEAGQLSQADHDWAMAAMIAAEGRLNAATNQALVEGIQARDRMAQAQNAVYQAQEKLELLESGPITDTLVRAEVTVDRALLAQEQALADLEAAQLYAPFDGVVMDVAVVAGDQVGTGTPILTLADMQSPLVCFWVEEADFGSVAVGNAVNVTFEALPDDIFTGEVVRVDPMLTTVDGMSAVQAWASVDVGSREVSLFSGMTADVEVVAAEARNVLLVPVQALRELSSGQYAVFVVGPDGELEMRTVTVGLTDLVNAEILEGLEAGEIVSLGEVE